MPKNKIPTAEEFMRRDDSTRPEEIKEMLIEFAKLHVKAALEAALEDSPTGSSTDIPSYEDMKFAILGAYPESLIV